MDHTLVCAGVQGATGSTGPTGATGATGPATDEEDPNVNCSGPVGKYRCSCF